MAEGKCVCVRVRMCVFVFTHHYAGDDGWYQTEVSWQPKQHSEDDCHHQTGHNRVLGEIGGSFFWFCVSVLCCLQIGLLRLGQTYLRLGE